MPTLISLRQEARQLGLRSFSRLKKADLADYIALYRTTLATRPALAVVFRAKNAKLPMAPTHFKGDAGQIDLEDYLRSMPQECARGAASGRE